MSNPRKKYSIVEFPNGLQIIPSCWINLQNNESIWPSYVKSRQTLDKLLIKAVIPIEIDKWDTCKIRRIFGSAGYIFIVTSYKNYTTLWVTISNIC